MVPPIGIIRGGNTGHGMMFNNFFVKNVALDDNRVLSIHFAIYSKHKVFILPLLVLFFFMGIMAILIYYSVRKTLNPVEQLIEASEKIGEGNLSHRINFKKNNEFKKVAASFNTMAEKLENMLKSKKDLLHLISHELRTPLTRIKLALEISDTKRSKDIIRTEIDDINELIEEILELSRLDHQEIEKTKEIIELNSLLKETFEKYPDEKFNFISVPINMKIYGHPALIKKAFINLLDNAIKYGNGLIPIKIRLYQRDDNVEIQIENQGEGLDEEDQKLVFKPFFRGPNSLKINAEGKGLGLSIVKKIVEINSGTITFQSSKQGPTRITITVPLYKS